jgi:hypothetical protein
MNVQLPGHARLPEPQLAFHPEREQDRGPHPLNGLLEFGPYSRSLVNPVLDPIRVATIAPAGEGNRLTSFINELEQAHAPKERKNYLPEWPGFSKVFGLRMVRADAPFAHIELPADLDGKVASAEKPHTVLAEELTRALRAYGAAGADYDLLMIMLPDRWQAGFEGPKPDAFDLHDYLKAHLAMRGLPSQIVRENRALSYFCRCSVAWRQGVALYCKAGGVPWKLADPEPKTAHIGSPTHCALKQMTADVF